MTFSFSYTVWRIYYNIQKIKTFMKIHILGVLVGLHVELVKLYIPVPATG
jgi:hypothetical protein